MALLILITLAILLVLVYLVTQMTSLYEQQVLKSRRQIDDLHAHTIRALFEAARESGAFKTGE